MDPETGRIQLHWEFIAGGSAGGCQVVRQHPLIRSPVAERTDMRSFLFRFSLIRLRLCTLSITFPDIGRIEIELIGWI